MDSKKQTIDINEILYFMEEIVRHPFPTICKHVVAGMLLNLLDEHNMLNSDDSNQIAKALCRANDEYSLHYIQEAREKKGTYQNKEDYDQIRAGMDYCDKRNYLRDHGWIEDTDRDDYWSYAKDKSFRITTEGAYNYQKKLEKSKIQ